MSSDSGAVGGPVRPPSDTEKQLLARLLSPAFPGREQLQKQAENVQVRFIDRDGSLELIPASGAPEAEVQRRIPVEAEIEDVDSVTIHVLLHVLNGFMNELEIYREDSKRIQAPLAAEHLRLIVL